MGKKRGPKSKNPNYSPRLKKNLIITANSTDIKVVETPKCAGEGLDSDKAKFLQEDKQSEGQDGVRKSINEAIACARSSSKYNFKDENKTI